MRVTELREAAAPPSKACSVTLTLCCTRTVVSAQLLQDEPGQRRGSELKIKPINAGTECVQNNQFGLLLLAAEFGPFLERFCCILFCFIIHATWMTVWGKPKSKVSTP